MISWPLLKITIKNHYKILSIFCLVLIIYFMFIAYMFDPKDMEAMNNMTKMIPKSFVSAMNFDSIAAPTLAGFLASYYYGFLILLFPMIFNIIVSNTIIAKLVDQGAMAYLLATPNSRKKIAFTQALFLLLSNVALIAILFIVGAGICRILFPGELDIKLFVELNAGALLIQLAVSAIGFLASCAFNESKQSLSVGAGLPIAFLLVQMLSGAGEKLSFLKYVTIFSLYNSKEFVTGEADFWLSAFILAMLSAGLYVAGIFLFTKKDLPL
ncbi:ABC transporter permease subunit [Bacillus sp. 1P06AnD]|uniref:ABC transporter permease subunit n=1 Tax=Bacillus sp. 1P06AnD TaxID=3132208 RepID=UPI0039A2FD33